MDLNAFEFDDSPHKVIAINLIGDDKCVETPFHQHRKAQLVMALEGFVQCKIVDAIWIVPPQCAVWIPSGHWHSNVISQEGNVCMLFVDPDCIEMPDHSCTISISPLLRELICHLSQQDISGYLDSPLIALSEVLIYELTQMPREKFNFPIPLEPRLNTLAKILLNDPSDRKTLNQWANLVAMSERTLSRLVKKEIGLTFGEWRGQLHVVVALQKLSAGMSVQRVTEDLGYESVSAFITFFKKVLGVSPKKYIKNRQSRFL
jgi:AraC-like DNA-binding protein/mannose-6-phosphate isomerase-like protein (cupin superfamily)